LLLDALELPSALSLSLLKTNDSSSKNLNVDLSQLQHSFGNVCRLRRLQKSADSIQIKDTSHQVMTSSPTPLRSFSLISLLF
jgi:hypothetical protein